MKNLQFRLLPALVILILFCGSVHATNLEITVHDGLDNSTIPQATIYLDGNNIGRTTAGGTYLITHSGLTDHKIRVVKSGYDDWEKTVGMNVTTLLVNMSKKSLLLKVQLFDSDSFSIIQNAEVRLTVNNETVAKNTDDNGVASFPVYANTVGDLMITSPDYLPLSPKSVEIGTENVNVQYWLLRNDRFSVIVTDAGKKPVTDAGVYIDSVLVGKTDSRGFLILQIERGKSYTFEIRKDGYQSYTEKKTIGTEEALMTVQISQAPIGAFVLVYDETSQPVAGASVSVNNAVAGFTDRYGKFVLENIVTGSYQLEIQKEGFIPRKESITVARQGEQFTVELSYEQANLTVHVQDKDQKPVRGARVVINGNDAGLSGDNGEIAARVRYNTELTISVQKDGYQPAAVQGSVIMGNAIARIIVTVERNPDWGFVGLLISGAVAVIVIFAMIRYVRKKPGRHIVRRNEI